MSTSLVSLLLVRMLVSMKLLQEKLLVEALSLLVMSSHCLVWSEKKRFAVHKKKKEFRI